VVIAVTGLPIHGQADRTESRAIAFLFKRPTRLVGSLGAVALPSMMPRCTG